MIGVVIMLVTHADDLREGIRHSIEASQGAPDDQD
jgi:hypothetical protein